MDLVAWCGAKPKWIKSSAALLTPACWAMLPRAPGTGRSASESRDRSGRWGLLEEKTGAVEEDSGRPDHLLPMTARTGSPSQDPAAQADCYVGRKGTTP